MCKRVAVFLTCLGTSTVSEANSQTKATLVAMASSEVSETAPSVVQNRFFTKKNRVEIGLNAGSILNESYSNTSVVGTRTGLFFSEKFGLEYNFSKYRSIDSTDLLALRSQEVCVDVTCRSIEPSFIRLVDAHQLQVVFAPIYGKINLFDWTILYSDLTLSAGSAQVSTSQGRKWAFTPGIGQRFYFSKSFSLRVDASDIFLKETVTQKDQSSTNWRHNWVATLGMSAFLNSGE